MIPIDDQWKIEALFRKWNGSADVKKVAEQRSVSLCNNYVIIDTLRYMYIKFSSNL